jgi:catechol 2,3-dioxygenase-like lactoylglutathione lyase family enzyme
LIWAKASAALPSSQMARCGERKLICECVSGNNEITAMAEPSSWAALVPELLVSDIERSLRFWRDMCGFTVLFERRDEGFAYLDLDGAQIMLDELGKTRDWLTAPLESPFGRGINLQVRVPAVEPALAALAHAGWPLFMEPEQKWYRTGEVETGVHQFLVQDPDGYLIRFSAYLGERSIAQE